MKENINVLDEIKKGACMGIDAISYIIWEYCCFSVLDVLVSEVLYI